MGCSLSLGPNLRSDSVVPSRLLHPPPHLEWAIVLLCDAIFRSHLMNYYSVLSTVKTNAKGTNAVIMAHSALAVLRPFFRSVLIVFLEMTSLHSLGIIIPQSSSLLHQMRFRHLPDLIWRIDLKIRIQFKKKMHYIDVFPQNFPCKYLTAGRGHTTQSKIKNILHTTYSNILATFDHY